MLDGTWLMIAREQYTPFIGPSASHINGKVVTTWRPFHPFHEAWKTSFIHVKSRFFGTPASSRNPFLTGMNSRKSIPPAPGQHVCSQHMSEVLFGRAAPHSLECISGVGLGNRCTIWASAKGRDGFTASNASHSRAHSIDVKPVYRSAVPHLRSMRG